VLDYFASSETVKEVLHWPKYLELSFQTAQMSVLMVFGGHHLPICLRPGGRGGAANKLEGKWKVSLYLVAPPQAAAGYSTKSSICWRTTFEDICVVRNSAIRPPPGAGTV